MSDHFRAQDKEDQKKIAIAIGKTWDAKHANSIFNLQLPLVFCVQSDESQNNLYRYDFGQLEIAATKDQATETTPEIESFFSFLIVLAIVPAMIGHFWIAWIAIQEQFIIGMLCLVCYPINLLFALFEHKKARVPLLLAAPMCGTLLLMLSYVAVAEVLKIQ
ncbi:hypothetical protein [Rosistilla carotiformis]|nr:hypothetical protein [Rosistilla carotiformis]